MKKLSHKIAATPRSAEDEEASHIQVVDLTTNQTKRTFFPSVQSRNHSEIDKTTERTKDREEKLEIDKNSSVSELNPPP